MTQYNIAELDTFYISFDEPNSETNWARVQQQLPNAKRVHGVLGFDRAHKACALASTTKRFVTIDGDNWLLEGVGATVIDDTGLENVCFSFKSRNVVNGLEYGNGGLKIWDRETLLRSNTHERADSTDFCWDIRYYQIDTLTTVSVTNCNAYQAWRAGYREGVKMSYVDGKPLDDFAKGMRHIWKVNLSRLHIWCSVGRDIEHGIWSIVGARQGLLEIADRVIENTWINDYVWFRDKWGEIAEKNPNILATKYGQELEERHRFLAPELDGQLSAWFKSVYVNPPRHGLMR